MEPDQLAFFDVVTELDPSIIPLECAAGVIECVEEEELPVVILGDGDVADVIADLLLSEGQRFLHTVDLAYLPPAIYVVTKEFAHQYPPGSVVFDLLDKIPDAEGVKRVKYRY